MQVITFLTGFASGAFLGFLLAALLHAGNVEDWEQAEKRDEEKSKDFK